LRPYETIFITHPELSEEDLAELQEKIHAIMSAWKGELVKLEDWGIKKLGYDIRKNSRGRFFLLAYVAATALVKELERNLRLNDRILKFQTVRASLDLSPGVAKTSRDAAPSEKVTKASDRPPSLPEQILEEAEKTG